jgi:hypothetical protein
LANLRITNNYDSLFRRTNNGSFASAIALSQALRRTLPLAWEKLQDVSWKDILCWLQHNYKDFDRKSAEEKERILGELVGNATFDWATGAALLKLAKAGKLSDEVANFGEEPPRIDPTYTVDEAGLTTRAEGTLDGPHPGRGKGYRPDPIGGRSQGDHRGHLLPEAGFDKQTLVNVTENMISEAPRSNLGAKKVAENYAIKLAAQNPKSLVTFVAEPLRAPGVTRPFAVTVWVIQDGRTVYGVTILNR